MHATHVRATGGRPLAALLFVFALVSAAWMILIPPFEKPDEISHLAYVQFVATQARLPIQGRDAPAFVELESHQPPLYYVVSALPYALAGKLGLTATDLARWQARVNPSGPAFRPAMTEATWWIQGQEPSPWDLLLIRAASLSLALLTLVFVHRTAWLTLASPPLALAATGVVAFLPQFTFISTSASNDTLASLYGALYVLLLIRLAHEPGSDRSFLLLGLVTGAGAAVKATVWVLWPLALIPILAGPQRLRHFALWLSSSVCVGGWWFVRNWALYHDVLGRQEVFNPARYAWNVVPRSITDPYFRGPFLSATFESFVAHFGFVSVAVHHLLIGAAAVAALVAAIGLLIEASLTRETTGQWRPQPCTLVLCGASVAAFAGLVFYNLTIPQPQGRYLFTAIGPLAILAVIGWRRVAGLVSPRLIGPLPACVLVLAITVNIYCLVQVIVPVYGADALQAWHLR